MGGYGYLPPRELESRGHPDSTLVSFFGSGLVAENRWIRRGLGLKRRWPSRKLEHELRPTAAGDDDIPGAELALPPSPRAPDTPSLHQRSQGTAAVFQEVAAALLPNQEVFAAESETRARFRQVEVVRAGGGPTATLPKEKARLPVGVAKVAPDSEREPVEWHHQGGSGATGLRRERHQAGKIGRLRGLRVHETLLCDPLPCVLEPELLPGWRRAGFRYSNYFSPSARRGQYIEGYIFVYRSIYETLANSTLPYQNRRPAPQ